MLVEIDDSLLLARPITGGFTYTLASYLGALLTQVEGEFGPRNRAFTILGIEFREGVPQLWFPGNCGHVVIQLSTSAMNDMNRALFQLSHEVVHLLDPSPGGTNSLEEGLATDFSLRYMASRGLASFTGDQRYDRVRQLVRMAFRERSTMAKQIRADYGAWKSITAQQILTLLPELPLADAEELARPF